MSNLLLRSTSGIVLLALTSGILLYAPLSWFLVFILAAIMLIGVEWFNIAQLQSNTTKILFTALLLCSILTLQLFPILATPILWLSVWYIYALLDLLCYAVKRPIRTSPLWKAMQGVICLSLFYTYAWLIYDLSPLLALVCIILISAVDIGGYAGGKLIGGKKLCPSISPHKTFAGLFGGIILCYLSYGICSFFSMLDFSLLSLAYLLPLCLIAQMGDLYQSMLKRQAHIKDSGTWFLGHGGIFDRTDGLIFAAPAFYLFLCVLAS